MLNSILIPMCLIQLCGICGFLRLLCPTHLTIYRWTEGLRDIRMACCTAIFSTYMWRIVLQQFSLLKTLCSENWITHSICPIATIHSYNRKIVNAAELILHTFQRVRWYDILWKYYKASNLTTNITIYRYCCTFDRYGNARSPINRYMLGYLANTVMVKPY